MSTYELRSQLSSLRSELSAIERENARLQAEVNAITSAVAAADNNLVRTHQHISTSLDTDNARLSSAHSMALQAFELQGEIAEIYKRLKQMELANKRIRDCNNTRYYEFVSYRRVRKMVQAMMDNLDIQMVTHEILEKAIEKQQLHTPDYWLTCVLLAVSAWRDDSQERAERALNRALELDKKRTAVLMLILNLRLDREQVAIKWFDMLRSLHLTGADRSMMLLLFSLLSKSVRENVSDSARAGISDYVRGLMKDSFQQPEHGEEAVVEKIRQSIARMSSDHSFAYPMLLRHCSAPDALRQPLALARNNAKAIDFLSAITTADVSARNAFLKEYVDEIVAAPCQVEQGVYDEIERNETIIRFMGDVPAAEAQLAQDKEREAAQLNLAGEVTRWVFDQSGMTEANVQMRLNMLTLLKDYALSAVGRHVQQYRSMFSSKATVAIDTFSVEADLEDISSAEQAASAYCAGKCAQDQAAVKDLLAYGLFAVGAGFLAGAFFTSFALFVLAGASVLVGVGLIFRNRSERKKIALRYESLERNLRAKLAEIKGEFASYRREFSDEDILSDRLVALLESL